jgi:DNA-binding transcriptional ArsR family regulator
MLNTDRALDALGDRTRRGVFNRLRHDTLAVGEIAHGMSVSRSAVSQHLKVLKDAGLVSVRVEGTRRFYGIDAAGIDGLRRWLDDFWDEALSAFKKAAEQQAAKGRRRR